MTAKVGPNWKYSSPKSTRSTLPVARARPGPKPQARNPTRARKKVARPSPNSYVLSECQKLEILTNCENKMADSG